RMQFVEVQQKWCGRYPPLTDKLVADAIAVKTWDDPAFNGIESYADGIQQSLSPQQGRLFRAVLIKADNAPEKSLGRLLLVVHHLVIDGVSWRILLEDIDSLYGQYQAKTRLNLAAKTSSYQQWGHFLTEYAASASLRQQRDYWLSGFDQQVTLLADLSANTSESALPVFSVTTAEQADLSEVEFRLNQTVTEQLLTRSNQAYRSHINELLLAGVLLGIHHWGGGHSIRLDLEGHGREALTDTIDLSQTLGWFTSVYPLTLTVEHGSLAELIGHVKDTYRTIPHNGIGFGLLKHLCDDPDFTTLPASEMVFNYLGQFDQVFSDHHAFTYATQAKGKEIGQLRKADHPLSLNGMVIGGQ
ncbi:MAG: condensation domain-containing protein, partial [Psychrosphaera sp.]|nr:condensation domain-containing protein [Psychrosphaera sp.]